MIKSIPSINILFKAFEENKELIKSTLKCQSIENYNDNAASILGVSVMMFIFIFLLALALWIFAIYATIKYWKFLPTFAQVVSILGLIPGIPGGPIITLVVVYASKSS